MAISFVLKDRWDVGYMLHGSYVTGVDRVPTVSCIAAHLHLRKELSERAKNEIFYLSCVRHFRDHSPVENRAKCQICMIFVSILYGIGGKRSKRCQILHIHNRWEIPFFLWFGWTSTIPFYLLNYIMVFESIRVMSQVTKAVGKWNNSTCYDGLPLIDNYQVTIPYQTCSYVTLVKLLLVYSVPAFQMVQSCQNNGP